MATFCIVIGVLMLLGFAGAGYLIGSYLMSSQTIVSLLSLSPATLYVAIGVGLAIGLIFCLNWVILGVNCINIKKLKRRRKKKAE